MTSASVLSSLAGMLASGGIEVVDCSGVLGPETPLLKLPPAFAKDTPPIKIHRISEYDKDGPFWAWNWLKVGEHSGTHFDAPHHWITGKDYADGYTDTLPVQRLVAPVNVLDFAKDCGENPDFLLTIDHVKAWEAKHGAINAGEWVVLRSDWDKRAHDEALFLNADATGPHTPGPTARISHTVSTSIMFSRSSDWIFSAKSVIVLRSCRSRVWATIDIRRCWSMSQATISVCFGERPRRGQSLRATLAPAIE